MRMSKKLQDLHSEAIREFDKIQSALRDERLQSLKDRRFYSIAGAQWEGDLSAQFENKPKLEINKIHLSIMRIIKEYRENRITVNFVSKDGVDNDNLADTCDGLYRADEQYSTANEAYDNAFEEGLGGGFGAWRLRAEYEDEEDEDNDYQRIMIEPIFDADASVFFDLNAKRQDKSDARKCFVISAIPREAYVEQYNDDVSSWPNIVHQHEFDWLTPDIVYVCEFYIKEETRHTVFTFQNLDGTEEKYSEMDFESDPELQDTLAAIGSVEVGQKKVRKTRVHKYLMNGHTILEDYGFIAGKHIPIVPFYGKRWFIDNVERCMGHVRLPKDAQRLKNMQISKLAEISALSSTEKPIFYPEQVAGHAVRWAEDNIKNFPYLVINPIYDADGNISITGPVGYTKPPMIPPAMAALLQITEQDINDLLGNQQEAEQIRPNTSGVAVELVQNKLDTQTGIYMSNFSKSIKRSGEIWLSMANELLVENGRKMKTITDQETVGSVELMRPIIGENGSVEYENDLSKAKYDVAVTVGPSSTTKRSGTIRALTSMMTITQDPETLQVLSSMAMMNMEGEGVADARKYFRKKLIRMKVIDPTEEEKRELMEEMKQQQPAAEQQYIRAAAMEAAARAEKARADTILTGAKAEETKAKTVKTLADINKEEKKSAIDAMRTMGEMQKLQQENIQQQQSIPQQNQQNNLQI